MNSDPLNPLELAVSVSRQQVWVLEADRTIWQAPVSTSRFGTGEEPGSNKTPTGLFAIAEMIGEGSVPGTVFQSRVATGKIWSPADPFGEEDLILTRILWLDGLESHNRNTHARYIYFHGTNQEHRIGAPASHGCIRLRNADIITLFGFCFPGMKVRIAFDSVTP